MYALYAPIQATYKESPFIERREDNAETVGSRDTESLQYEYDSIGKEQTKTATELAYAEVSYNRKNLAGELQNESRQHNRQQNRTKRREKEI